MNSLQHNTIKKALTMLSVFCCMQLSASSGYPFIKNEGQWEQEFQYRLNLKNSQYFFYPDRLVVHVWNPEKYADFLHAMHHQEPQSNSDIEQHVYEIRFQNSSVQNIESQNTSPYYYNYYLGNNPQNWKSGVRSAEKITYKSLWPNIDLVYYTQNGNLKYDILIHPGADASLIKMAYQFTDGLRLNKDNELFIQTLPGKVKESKPLAWQHSTQNPDSKTNVKVKYRLNANTLTYEIADNYDPSRVLVIDPEIIFSTYSGSTGDNWGTTACNDLLGNAYGAGMNFAPGYPITTGAFQSAFGGNCDASISKFNQTGTALLFSTYLGGNRAEIPVSIVCDAQNNLIVMGITGSSNYPVTSNAFDNTFGGGSAFGFWNTTPSNFLANYPNGSDLFLAKFNTSGTQLLGSTFMGGTANDGVNSSTALNKNYGDQFRGEVNIDQNGNILGISSTYSSDFPNQNAWQSSIGGGQDACVFKFNPQLNQLVFSSYIGGVNADAGYGITKGSGSRLYVCGGTENSTLSGISGLNNANAGNVDGFILCVNDNGNTVTSGTFLGSSGYDQAYFIQLDLSENVYVLGQTLGNYPINANGNSPFYSVPNGSIFIHKLNNTLNTSLWSTRVGTNQANNLLSPSAFLVDDCNYISFSLWGGSVNQNNAGGFSSTNGLPTTPGAYQAITDGSDFYLCVLKSNASAIEYGSFFGGNFIDEHVDGGTSRFDKSGAIYQAVCAGCGGMSNMPTTPGAWSNSNNSANCNLAVFKFDLSSFSAIANASTNVICNGQTVSFSNLSTGTNQFLWVFGDGTTSNSASPTHTFSTTGLYDVMLIAFGQGPCANTDTLIIPIDVQGAPIVSIPPIPPVCPGDTIQINTSGAIFYNWVNAPGILPGEENSSNPFVAPIVNSTYTLIAANNCGVDTVSFPIEVIPFDLSITLSDGEICQGQSITLTASGATTYNWSPVALFSNPSLSSHTLTPSQTTTYVLTATNAANCTKTDSVRVLVSVSPLAQTFNDTLICYQSILQLTGSGGTTNTWYNVNQPSVVYSNPHQLTADTNAVWVFQAQNACGTDIDTVVVKVSRVYPAAGPNATVCLESPVQVFASGGINYFWQPPNFFTNPLLQNTTLIASNPAELFVTVTDTAGCSEKVKLNIDFYPKSFVDAGPDQMVTFGDQVQLLGNASPGNYLWIPFKHLSCPTCLSSQTTLFESTWFTLFLTDPNGCQFRDSVYVLVEGSIYIPSSFSPNEDGINETFNVNGVDIVSYTLSIFNRWGQQVFTTSDLNKGWDGKVKNDEATPDVYVYKLDYKLNSGRTGERTGTVTLVR